jgi:glycosyltransferase involved in cell wall biosynthesis
MSRHFATVQITDAFPPVVDGVSITVQNYARELNRRGVATAVIAPGVWGQTDDEDYPVHRYLSLPTIVRPPYRFGVPGLDPLIWRRLEQLEVDLVHCHSPFSASRVALRLASIHQVPLIATFHSKYRDDLIRAVPIRPLVDRRIRRVVEFFESADEVWIPSQSAVGTLREYGYQGPVHVASPGTDMDASPDAANARARAEEILDTDGHRPVLLYVGQLVWEKNLEMLLLALLRLRSAGSTFAMAFIGEGYASAELGQLARKLGLESQVRFPGVIRDRDALKACYARADLFLFPSRYDTHGLVVREAAAQCVPTVFVPDSDAAEGVVDGVNGFVAEDTPEAYADRIRAAVENPDLIRACGDQARRTLCRPWSEVVAGAVDRYRELIDRKR